MGERQFAAKDGGGGAERITLNLIREFVGRSLKVDLILCRVEGPYLASVPDDVRIIDCDARTSLEWRGAVERYLTSSPPTVLLAQMEGAGIVALWARRRVGGACRVVVTSHTVFSRHADMSSSFKERWLMLWFIRWFYRQADAIIGVSKGVADDLAGSAWLRRDRVQVIYNPVVTDELLAKATAPLDHPWFAPGAPAVILSAGRLTAPKDYPTLLRAFARLTAGREARLIVLGEGEARGSLEALARELGVADQVFFASFVENPFAYMARADLFALSSAWEGLPTVLIEAMACGTPVVATDGPSGPAEILENGRYGRLVPVGDAGALATAMAATLDAPPEAESLRARAMMFHANTVADAYLAALGLEDVPT
ncbi:MAG: glycosyltransferase [Proteobacteria bacterium]|nr:glycosyltransferase [Pseudomonadota bacterium]